MKRPCNTSVLYCVYENRCI